MVYKINIPPMSQMQVPLAMLAEESGNLGMQIVIEIKRDLRRRMYMGSLGCHSFSSCRWGIVMLTLGWSHAS